MAQCTSPCWHKKLQGAAKAHMLWQTRLFCAKRLFNAPQLRHMLPDLCAADYSSTPATTIRRVPIFAPVTSSIATGTISVPFSASRKRVIGPLPR